MSHHSDLAPTSNESSFAKRDAAEIADAHCHLAETFVARTDLSGKFPGLSFRASRNRLAILGVAKHAGEAQMALKRWLGAKWTKATKAEQPDIGDHWCVVVTPERLARLDIVLTIVAGRQIQASAAAGVIPAQVLFDSGAWDSFRLGAVTD